MVKQDIQSTTTKATTLKPLYPLYIPIISPLKPLYPHYPHLMVHDYIRAISPLYPHVISPWKINTAVPLGAPLAYHAMDRYVPPWLRKAPYYIDYIYIYDNDNDIDIYIYYIQLYEWLSNPSVGMFKTRFLVEVSYLRKHTKENRKAMHFLLIQIAHIWNSCRSCLQESGSIVAD